jgi:hypothetical protein
MACFKKRYHVLKLLNVNDCGDIEEKMEEILAEIKMRRFFKFWI